MKHNLTNEQIARVFAMYMPCATMQSGNNFNRRLVGVGGFEDAGFCYGRLKNDASVASQFVSNFQIVLTPLSAISDEDAIEVAKLNKLTLGKWETDYDYCTHNGFGKENIGFRYRELVGGYTYLDKVCVENYQVYQYLIQKGYAVPLFIEVGHPDNGKTAIELGIAIDKTKLAA